MTRKIYGPVRFHVFRTEANFDKACELAWAEAIRRAGIDEDGHSSVIPDWERSNCELDVEFKSLRMTHGGLSYKFAFVAIKNEDD